MAISTLLTSIATAIEGGIAEVSRATVFYGRLDLKAVRQYSHQLPAVFVGCEDIAVKSEAELEFEIGFVAVIVTSGSRQVGAKVQRHIDSGDLAGKLTVWLIGQTFADEDFTSGPTDIDAQNGYTKEIAEAGLSMWAVAWNSTATLDDSELTAPPASIHGEWYADEVDDYIDKIDEETL